MKRRQVLVQGAASATLTVLAGGATAAETGTKPMAIQEQVVEITTPEGKCTTFVAHPAGGGSHPAVLIFMDAAGYRKELCDMARRLAGAGYFALLPNLYYRSGVLDLGPADVNQQSEWFKRTMTYGAVLNVPKLMSDTDAILAWLDTQKAAKKGPMGVMGFCMSGAFVLNAAARHPERFAAAATIYGTSLVTDKPDSPHKLVPGIKGALYFAYGEKDPFIPHDQVEGIRASLAGKTNAEVEVYPGLQHGFAFPERYAYDKAGTDHLFAQLEALYGKTLG